MRTWALSSLIIALLLIIGIAAFRHDDSRDTEQAIFRDPRDRTMYRLSVLERRCVEWKQRTGRYPRTLDEAVDGLSSQGKKDLLSDAWGRSLQFSSEEASYELRSAGPDGQFNTDDDLSVRGPVAKQ